MTIAELADRRLKYRHLCYTSDVCTTQSRGGLSYEHGRIFIVFSKDYRWLECILATQKRTLCVIDIVDIIESVFGDIMFGGPPLGASV